MSSRSALTKQPAAAEGLVALERVIADGMRTFVDVGRALSKINEEGLYKAAGFDTFEAYCRARWDMGRHYAYRLIEASGVVDHVANCQQKLPAPAVESHARELAKLPPKQQPKAWKKAVETADGAVTAKHVASVVAEFLPKPPPVVHQCPRHGCQFDDGKACPVCAEREAKGLRNGAVTKPADPPLVSQPAPCLDPEPARESGPEASDAADVAEFPEAPDLDGGSRDQRRALEHYVTSVLSAVWDHWPDATAAQLIDCLTKWRERFSELESERCSRKTG